MRASFLCIAVAMTVTLFGQAPQSFYPWWDGQIAQNLNLSSTQKDQVRGVVSAYRTRLAEARAAAMRAEDAVEAAFNEESVNEDKANAAIRELAAARQNVTLIVSEMSLKLRMVLTQDQWKELQRRRAEKQQERANRP
jgi:Spy/CpxP family protein refolding chaperone